MRSNTTRFRKDAALAALGALAVGAGPATAHHGFGTYDLDADIEISGTLVGLDFVNPHSWLHLEVKRGDETVTYHCEMRSATSLRRSGWSRDMFTVGEHLTVTGSPDRRHPEGCYLGTVEWADGSSIDRYGQRTPPSPLIPEDRPARRPDGTPNIAGDWAGEQMVMSDPRGIVGTLVPLSMTEELETGEVPAGAAPFPGSRGADDSLRSFSPTATRVPLTETGMAAAEAYDDLSTEDNPRLRCEATSIIFDWTFDTPIHRITQTDDTITLQYGQFDFVRTIHLDMDEHPADIAPSRAGHSIGRWDGDELVVDTVGFAPGILYPPIMHGEGLHVVERYRLDPAQFALTRAYAAEDPEYFEGAFTGQDRIMLSRAPFGADLCLEPEFREYDDQATADAGEPDKPWWRFWP